MHIVSDSEHAEALLEAFPISETLYGLRPKRSGRFGSASDLSAEALPLPKRFGSASEALREYGSASEALRKRFGSASEALPNG